MTCLGGVPQWATPTPFHYRQPVTHSPLHTTLGYLGQTFSAGGGGVDFAPRGHSALTGAIFVTVGEEGATGTQ